MSKIKILYISHAVQMAGGERCLLALLNHLDKKSFEPVVVFPCEGPLKNKVDELGIRTYISQLEWWVKVDGHIEFQSENMVSRVTRLQEIIDREAPDIIQTNTSVVWEGAVAAKEKGIPHIWHLHEILQDHPSFKSIIPLPLLYLGVDSLSKRIVTVSRGMKESLSNYLDPKKMVTIYNGIDTDAWCLSGRSIREELNIPDDCFVAVTVAQVTKYKGYDNLVDAIAILKKKKNNIKFILVGDGSEEAVTALKSRIAQMNLSDDVYFLGYRDDVPKIIKGADVFVLPSIREAFPLVVLEAMALGKAVVATDCCGPSEMLVEGETGFIVPVNDPGTLSEKILEALSDRQRLVAMGEAGRQRFSAEFTVRAYARQFESLYNDVVGKNYFECSNKDRAILNGFVEQYQAAVDDMKEKTRLKNELKQREQQLQIAKASVIQLEGRLRLIHSSLSWKVTAPLRGVGHHLPQLLKYVNGVFGEKISTPDTSGHKICPGESLSTVQESVSTPGSIGIHLHLYYFDLLEEIGSYLKNVPFEFNLYVSVADESHIKAVDQFFSSFEKVKETFIRAVPNRGRDVAPFVVTFADQLRNNDFVCHIHTKKSLHTGNQQDSWRRHFYENLLGSPRLIRQIFGLFQSNKDIGIIYPETVASLSYWGHSWLSNKQLAGQLCSRFGISCDPSGYVDSPMGTMFWAKTDAIRPLLEQRFKLEDFPEEAGQTDGTIAHTLERMIVPLALKQGFSFCEINCSRNEYSLSFGSRNLYQYWSKDLAELKNTIRQFDVISFDIFDTLLARPLLNPDSAFDLLALEIKRKEGIGGFRSLRKSAEADVRAGKSFNSDVRIEEVYNRIGEKLKLDKPAIARLCFMEKEIEHRLNRPRHQVVQALKFAREIGKHIVLVSDMYLDLETVRKLLEESEIKEYDELFISSETGLRKDNLSMWLKMLELFPKGSILHIGDNEHSDVQIPSDMNIPVYHVMSPKNLFENCSLGRNFPIVSTAENPGSSALLGLAIDYLCRDPFSMKDGNGNYLFSDKFGFGYVVLGPVIFSYSLWLLKLAVRDKISKVLFLAREGYLLKKIFDMIQAHPDVQTARGTSIESVYLLASRRATSVPAIIGVADALVLLKKPYCGTLHNLLECRFGIEQHYCEKNGIENSYIELPADYVKLSALVTEHFDVVAAKARAERTSYLHYLKEAGIVGCRAGEVAVSDLGYSGNIQKALSKLLAVPLTGAYFATCFDVKEDDRLDNTFKGFFTENDEPNNSRSAVYRHSLLLESILTSPDGQLVRFENCGGQQRPVYAGENSQFNELEEIHQGIISYCGDVLSIFGKYILDFEPRSGDIDQFFERMITRGKIDGKILSQLKVDDKYCSDSDVSALPGDCQ